MRFSERLQALAHCHDLLVKDNWHGASFHDLVSAQMRPFGETNAGRIDATGPPVILKPEAVQHLGLALHELATNASKHGALSGPQGEVLIRWQVDETTTRFESIGCERGGPPRYAAATARLRPRRDRADRTSRPQRHGILDFAPAGVNWTFEFLRQ